MSQFIIRASSSPCQLANGNIHHRHPHRDPSHIFVALLASVDFLSQNTTRPKQLRLAQMATTIRLWSKHPQTRCTGSNGDDLRMTSSNIFCCFLLVLFVSVELQSIQKDFHKLSLYQGPKRAFPLAVPPTTRAIAKFCPFWTIRLVCGATGQVSSSSHLQTVCSQIVGDSILVCEYVSLSCTCRARRETSARTALTSNYAAACLGGKWR